MHTTYQVFRSMAEALAPRGFFTVGDFVRGYPAGTAVPPPAGATLDEPLATAVREQRAIAIRYAGRDGVTERMVEPLHCQGDYLVAYCHLRREERTFRIARIRAAWWPEA